MHTRIQQWSARLYVGIASEWCWRGVLAVLVCGALWFVASAQYPMAFDENYHFGLIQLHAHQWLPFFTSQPGDSGVYGAIARDPSYLYHWLFSLPYRLLTIFTNNQMFIVIVLRLLNVALFVWGITLYRKVLRRLGVGPALSNSLFAVFVLIPVVPFLAAHINYDNILMVLVPATALLVFRIVDGFADRVVNGPAILALIGLLTMGSIMKYPFLPVAVAAVVFVLWRWWRTGLLTMSGVRGGVRRLGVLPIWKRVALVGFCLISLALFAERYAVNIVSYHNPVPDCDAVISVQECMKYGPYGRDFRYEQAKPANFHANIFAYAWQWLWGMWYRLFFAISHTYSTARPLPVISLYTVVLSALGVLALLWKGRAVFGGQPKRLFILGMTTLYLGVLFATEFQAYARTGRPVAINGRYLIPFLPFIFAFAGLAWLRVLRGVRSRRVLAVAALLTVVVFLAQGGGTQTFIVRSADDWMWNNSTVRSVNRQVRSVLWPTIIGKHWPD